MMNIKRAGAFIVALVLAPCGCATTGGVSNKVQIYDQTSTLFEKCTKLAPIEATATALTLDQAADKAKHALAEVAAKVNGDSVVFLSVRRHGFSSATAQGIALQCFNGAANAR